MIKKHWQVVALVVGIMLIGISIYIDHGLSNALMFFGFTLAALGFGKLAFDDNG